MTLPVFLSQKDILTALGLKSPHVIRRMIREGKLPEPVDLGGARRWPASVLRDIENTGKALMSVSDELMSASDKLMGASNALAATSPRRPGAAA
jgi:predicted DNA-binding transcriptional regulator AlpA